MSELVAIDLGTGTVIGTVGRRREGQVELVARAEEKHHPDAVREGRIVDRDRAAETLRRVISGLESQVNLDTSRAHFAISARRLHQEEITESVERSGPGEFPDDTLDRLALQRTLNLPGEYFVVSDRVMEKTVDGTRVGSFAGQFGREARVRWSVQALPQADLQSRLAVLEQAGLVPGSLVLEPIAAVRAAFPEERLKIRLMLLDFGAGTLDATLLSRGRLEGVTSVGGSGDQLTEALEETYGLTFDQAQRAKHGLAGESRFESEDWTGRRVELSRQELISTLMPVVRDQLQSLRDRCEGWSPDQICLAGGGAQFPFLPRIVSKVFDVREADILNQPPPVRAPLKDSDGLIKRSSDYTVIGVLQSAVSEDVRKVFRFEVNGETRLRAVRSAPTLEELAREEGIRETEPEGEAVMVVVGGETHTRRPGETTRIQYFRNGDEANGDREVRSGDRIRIVPPEETEEEPEFRAEEFLPDEALLVRWENRTYRQGPQLVDEEGKTYTGDDRLEDGKRYERRTSFDYETLLQRLRSATGDIPEEPLFSQRGTYRRDGSFDVGDEVELVAPVEVEDYGLGRLEEIHPPDQPRETSLT